MRVFFDGDYPETTGQFIPGEEIPERLASLPVERLRFVRGEVIDAGMIAAFFIDPQGRKHVERGTNRWQFLRCRYDDVLICTLGVWRVATEEDKAAAAAKVLWAPVRSERNSRLAACDWTQLPDAPLTTVQRREWQDYRAALRDITRQADPAAVQWPEKPE